MGKGMEAGNERVQRVVEEIIRHGWTIVEDPGDAGIAYTVGLCPTFDLPEVVVTGIALDDAYHTLRGAVHFAKGSDKPLAATGAGLTVMLAGRRYAFRAVPSPNLAHLPVVDHLYQDGSHSGRVVQMVRTDPEGRFPWERGYDAAYHPLQPLLYTPIPNIGSNQNTNLPEDEMDNSGFKRILKRTRGHIRRHGWGVIEVHGTEKEPGFAYSVGLQETFGHPEIIMCGVKLETAHTVINRVGEAIRSGGRFGDMARSTDFTNLPLVFRRVSDENVDILHVATVLRDQTGSGPVEALQAVWPDPKGLFPWDKGFDISLRMHQPPLWQSRPRPVDGPDLH